VTETSKKVCGSERAVLPMIMNSAPAFYPTSIGGKAAGLTHIHLVPR
jgi:hypothetical protein